MQCELIFDRHSKQEQGVLKARRSSQFNLLDSLLLINLPLMYCAAFVELQIELIGYTELVGIGDLNLP